MPAFRGDEQDVLDRYYQAALAHQAEVVVRITSDCPMLDDAVSDKVVRAFLAVEPDYASNVLERSYPRGLDTEVLTFAALERAWREATVEHHRAHVTPYLYQNPQLFRLLSVTNAQDFSRHRWTVDTADDLAFAREVYARFIGGGTFSWSDVLALIDREPALIELNRAVRQKELHEA